MTLPAGRVLVSDDIRYEIGGKNSVIGIYALSMDFAQPELPPIIPKVAFTIMLNWRDRAEAEPVKVQIYGPADAEQPLVEFHVDPRDRPPADPDLSDGSPALGIVAQLTLEGVPLRAPGAFLGFVSAGDARERILRLPVRHRPVDPAQLLASLGITPPPAPPPAP